MKWSKSAGHSLAEIRAAMRASAASFTVHLVVLEPAKVEVLQSAEIIYRDLKMHGLHVFFDDRDKSQDVKFKDADSLGLPIRVTVDARGLQSDELEVVTHHNQISTQVPIDNCVERMREMVDSLIDSHTNAQEIS